MGVNTQAAWGPAVTGVLLPPADSLPQMSSAHARSLSKRRLCFDLGPRPSSMACIGNVLTGPVCAARRQRHHCGYRYAASATETQCRMRCKLMLRHSRSCMPCLTSVCCHRSIQPCCNSAAEWDADEFAELDSECHRICYCRQYDWSVRVPVSGARVPVQHASLSVVCINLPLHSPDDAATKRQI